MSCDENPAFFHLFKERMKNQFNKNDSSDFVVWGVDGVINIISHICYKNSCKGR
jgi:hypothetical protein